MAKIGFDAVPAWKDLVPAAISLVESHLQLRSHKDRINKLGPDGKTRFERDLNGTILFSFLKAMSQVDKFTGRCSEIQEKLKIESIHSGDEHLQFLSNSIAEVNCVAPTLPEDVAGVLQSMIDVRKQRVSDVDVWALGVCLHCVASNAFPFVDEQEVRTKSIGLSNINRACRGLISSMLEKVEEIRINMEDVVWHPWLTQETATEEPDFEALPPPSVWALLPDVSEWRLPSFPRKGRKARRLWPLAMASLMTGIGLARMALRFCPGWDSVGIVSRALARGGARTRKGTVKATELLQVLPMDVPLAPQAEGVSKNAKRNERRRSRKHSEEDGASSDSSGWAIAYGGDPEFSFSPAMRMVVRQVSSSSHTSHDVPDMELPPPVVLPRAEEPPSSAPKSEDKAEAGKSKQKKKTKKK
eukprot:g13250.t1